MAAATKKGTSHLGYWVMGFGVRTHVFESPQIHFVCFGHQTHGTAGCKSLYSFADVQNTPFVPVWVYKRFSILLRSFWLFFLSAEIRQAGFSHLFVSFGKRFFRVRRRQRGFSCRCCWSCCCWSCCCWSCWCCWMQPENKPRNEAERNAQPNRVVFAGRRRQAISRNKHARRTGL